MGREEATAQSKAAQREKEEAAHAKKQARSPLLTSRPTRLPVRNAPARKDAVVGYTTASGELLDFSLS